jgi:Fe-S cluster assembly scaffold protein SufB
MWCCLILRPSKVVRWKGIIFMSISEAIKEHPELVRKYLEQSFHKKIILCRTEFSCFLWRIILLYSKGVRCPMELSTFRINQAEQDSLKEPMIADEGSYVITLKAAPHRVVTKPAACRSSGISRLGRCWNQIFDRTKLVSRKQRR